METPPRNQIHLLVPRIILDREPVFPSAVLGMETPSRVFPREAEDTCTSENANMCEKPASQKKLTVPLTLAIVIPVVGVIIFLIYLHRRNIRRSNAEERDDPNKDLDFGMGDKPSAVSNLRKSIFGEKGLHKHQLSMDMDMSTPYLLPPQVHNSKESLHSLAHSFQRPDDPYGPVGQYTGSEVGSIRTVRRGPGGDQSSQYSASTRSGVPREVGDHSRISFPMPPPRAADPLQRLHSPASPSSPLSPTSPSRSNFLMERPEPPQAHAQSTPYPDEQGTPVLPRGTDMPSPDIPHTAGTPSTPGDRQSPPPTNFAMPMSARIETPDHADSLPSHPVAQQAQLDDVRDYSSPANEYTPAQSPPPAQRNVPSNSTPQILAPQDRESYYSDGNQHDFADYDDESRGRRTTRFLDGAQRGSQMLAAPQFEDRRLSVGFRPLPPNEIMDTEDPEHRANRIRSFYKEYFEDSQPQPPMPSLPRQDQTQGMGPGPGPYQPPPQAQTQYQADQYYEDYDGDYMGNTYMDHESKSFVSPMPYAQPVHRRAMTPPPRGPRMRGPMPPRIMHGSMGGMSAPGGRGPFRPGSANSSAYGPRPGSSASAAPRRRQGPPPPALTTLPNPAKLGDDSFALIHASDFAPPDNFKDRVAGRSQSPVPEKRAYHLGVPVHSPLVSSYDELPSVPSPHMLRKSGTFTGLDFAPPKRFKDDNDMKSDAGSIRSNRSNHSGISPLNQAAIRAGAGRVSRLPTDNVFVQSALAEQLRPEWGMRS
ncbi:uncharacterized protein DNG_06608 [Cephalotrichum gorgonifer]|uniref:Uncharacterized protein n=1 Tax=Cephalotrichum gorgonifer TaxID=2041049 RepID=A0AAE8N317_9PEZI|nr:uncharacterized protein DNG_06608 [Cephalotrichum gorgonifer]